MDDGHSRGTKRVSLSRRGFLRASAATGALAALGLGRGRADQLGIPIGLQLYTLYTDLATDFEGTLRHISGIGIREVELINFPGRSPGYVRRAVDDAGLRAISIHLGGDDLVSQPQKQIDLAAELGVAYLICPDPLASRATRSRPEYVGAYSSLEAYIRLVSTMTVDDWRWNADIFNRIGEQARRSGIQFGYHNHSMEFRRFGDEVAYEVLLRQTDPKWVTFEMDCGWVESSGAGAVAYLQKYPARFQLLHIKDIKRRADPGTEMKLASTEVGRGIIKWQEIFSAAPRAGVKHCFIELEPPFDRSALESVRMSYKWLHTRFADYG